VTTDNAADATTMPASPGSPPSPDAGLRTALRVLAVGLSLLMVAWGAVTLASVLGRATEHRSATYAGIRVLDIDVGFESVQIVGKAEATAVSMERSYTWSLSRPTIGNRRDGDVLSVTSSRRFTVGLGCSGRIRLVVPNDAEVRAHGSDGSLTLRELDGLVDVSTSDASVNASRLTGPLTLRTSDGSVEATGLRSQQVDAVTSDGSVRLTFVVPPPGVTARTSDGSILVVVPADGTAYDVSATTSDGGRDVSVPTDPDSSHRMELTTSDGSIRVTDQP
jgi:hypothetical protein